MNLYNVATREQIARVVNGMGHEGFLQLANSLEPAGAKYGDETMGTFEFLLNLLNQLSPEVLGALKRGEMRLTVEEIVQLLIDHTGRGIPAHLGVTSKVKNENQNFSIEQPAINYAEILAIYLEAFHDFPELKFLETTAFEDASEKKKEILLTDGLISNLVKRAHMPIPTPQLVVGDYGKVLQEIFLVVMEKMYKKHFSDRAFNNYRNNDLENKVSIIDGVGYDKFMAMLSGGPNAMWYFPRALQGFSINAAREAMKILSGHSLALSGAISTTLAIAGNVEKMAGSFNTPGYDCSAVAWRSAGYSLYAKAIGGYFFFAVTDGLADAGGRYSSGLLFIG